MARPLRRVLIGLSIRIGISLRELEQCDMPTIRQYLAMLDEINKPSKERTAVSSDRQQTPDEMMAAVRGAIGHIKE